MAPVIDELDDITDGLEDELLTGESREIRHGLRDARRTAIALRRYLAPQRDAMARLQTEDAPWLDGRQKARLREVTDRVQRYVEDLDEVRERAAVVQDELMNRLSEQMNRNMYLLSVVAAIMLPLGFLTGLLGINVGGIPGADSSIGFMIVCALLAGIGIVEVLLVRRLYWI
jgi:zinc transporter